MIAAVARRTGHFVAVLILVTLGTVALVDLFPGSPGIAILGDTATPELLAAFDAKYGFDRPLIERYLDWLGQAATGNFGDSIRLNQPVTEVILSKLPVTVELAIAALLLAIIIGIPLALFTAERPGGIADRVFGSTSSALVSIPGFVMALLLAVIFAVQLKWLPVGGWVPLDKDVLGNLRHVALPALALALVEIPVIHRVLRSDALTTLNQEYVLAARARGLGRVYVLFRHVLRPSSFSLMTMLGLMAGRLLGGTVIVETIFALPGIGSTAVIAIGARDVTLVQGIVAFIAVAYIVINALIDVSYAALDPRVRKR
jgi:peptide/nickel transport system permease protein